MRRSPSSLRIVIFGLSITSAWGNGHATTYRSLVRGLWRRGHRVLFYERQQPWYAAHRDLPAPDFCTVTLYDTLEALDRRFRRGIDADLVIVGSYVPEGARLAEWALNRTRALTAFYDIDTPVTLAWLSRSDCPYLSAALIPEFDLYLSFTGGPTLEPLRRLYGARHPRSLYCSADPELYFPQDVPKQFDLGYLGTYSKDRHAALEQLLCEPARHWPKGRFCVAGAQYPAGIAWPRNVERTEHLPPAEHRRFYNAQRFTLNITRSDMVASGHSPSVRLFEAAACGVPILSDEWHGLADLFTPGQEILLGRSTEDALHWLRELPDTEARAIGARACERVLAEHTGDHRARQLESYLAEHLETADPPSEACDAN